MLGGIKKNTLKSIIKTKITATKNCEPKIKISTIIGNPL